MAKNRMAGEELDKQTPVAQEAKKSVLEAGEKGDVNKLEEQVMDKREIQAKMKSGMSADDIYNFTKEHGINYNKKGRAFMESQGDYKIGKGKDQWGDVSGDSNPAPDVPTPETPEVVDTFEPRPDMPSTPATPPPAMRQPINFAPPGDGNIFQSQDQNVFQDNDVNVTGDGNTVNQDNSVRQHGGVQVASNGLAATNLMDNYVLNLRKRSSI